MERTKRHFDEQLGQLKEKLLRMGGLTEQAIERSVRCLVERDSDLARQVLDSDDLIDQLDNDIDEMCLEMLALHQPVADELRFVTTAMKLTTDLERIADHAANIAERALELNELPQLKPYVDMPLMAEDAQRILRLSLDAFVRQDAEAATATIALDAGLNRRMEQIFRELLTYMVEDPSTTSRALRLMFIAKYFERIGDMAKNICEQVVFLAEGRVIKHRRVSAEGQA